jgi:nucleoid-associated protein YgaU
MVSKSNSGGLFVCLAATSFAAWIAIVLAFAAFDPFGLVRSASDETDDRAAPHRTHAVTALLSARPGPAGPLVDPAGMLAETAPVFTHVRFDPRSRRAVFAGRGKPDARIAILLATRVVVYTRVRGDGHWLAAATFDATPAPLAFTIEQRDALTGDLIVGGDINLHIPANYRRSVTVSSGDPAATEQAFRLVAVKAESDSLGPAASRAFDRFFAQQQGGRGADGYGATVTKVAGAWQWLDDANRSYQDEIVERLRRGGGGFGGPLEARPEERDDDRARGHDRQGDRERHRGWNASRDVDRDADVRPIGVNDEPRDQGGAGVLVDWLWTARRSYETEIIPRLTGALPRAILTREELDRERDRLDRQAREARLRQAAAERAEREREEAERRRLEAEERRRAAEAEAGRIAEERARLERLAAERARAAERGRQDEAERRAAERAERERLAALETDRRAAEEEAARRAEAERRRREEAERRQNEADRRRQQARLAEEERLRRMLEQEEEVRRQREAEQSRRLAELRERREAARRELERRAEAERRRAEARRAEEERRSRLLDQAEQRRREREEEQRRRLAELRERREAARRRLAEREPSDGDNRSWWGGTGRLFGGGRDEERGPPLPEKQQANRETFTRRDTTIQYTTRDGDRAGPRPDGSRSTSWKDMAPVPTRNSRVATKRRARVKQYRRRTAARRVIRCNGAAGQRITPPGVYVVKRGDSLWRIARRHYNRGSLYPVIHRANRSKIRVPRLIYPCQRFRLPALRFR